MLKAVMVGTSDAAAGRTVKVDICFLARART